MVVVIPLFALESHRRQKLICIRLWLSKFLRVLYTVKLPYKSYGLLFALIDLHLCISNLSTLNPCNQTVTTLHVSTNSQHVFCFMLAKHDHVASIVAETNLLVGTASLLRLHWCYHQCNEDSDAHSHNTLILQKQAWIGLVLSKWNLEIAHSYVNKLELQILLGWLNPDITN